jgi:UDP-N-acetylmuramyl pentapeptide synthase
VADVTHDSRAVTPGSLFAAVVGRSEDGHDRGAEALERAEHTERDLLPAGDPAEDVDEDAADRRVGEHQRERRGHRVG